MLDLWALFIACACLLLHCGLLFILLLSKASWYRTEVSIGQEAHQCANNINRAVSNAQLPLFLQWFLQLRTKGMGYHFFLLSTGFFNFALYSKVQAAWEWAPIVNTMIFGILTWSATLSLSLIWELRHRLVHCCEHNMRLRIGMHYSRTALLDCFRRCVLQMIQPSHGAPCYNIRIGIAKLPCLPDGFHGVLRLMQPSVFPHPYPTDTWKSL